MKLGRYRIGKMGHALSLLMVERIYARDLGLCAKCGRDTEALRSALFYVSEHAEAWGFDFEAFRLAVGVNARRFPRRLWEIDHRIPQCEGGGDSKANLRTLCISCHQEATRQAATQRALQRRREQNPAKTDLAAKVMENERLRGSRRVAPKGKAGNSGTEQGATETA
jgi:hypothetical protein